MSTHLMSETSSSIVNSGDLFGEKSTDTILASIIAIIVGALTTVAGIGGGGLFVLIYGFIFGIGVKTSVPLSAATIFGGAIGKYFRTATEKHPNLPRSLINYDVAVFVQTAEVVGTIFGVLLNLVLPNIIVIILLFFVLLYTGFKTWKKGRSMYQKELDIKSKDSQMIELASFTNSSDKDTTMPGFNENTEKTYDQFNMFSIRRSMLLATVIITCSLVKVFFMSGYCERNHAGYWFVHFSPILFAMLTYVTIIKKFLVEKEEVSSDSGVICWNKQTMFQLVGLGLFSGTASGMLGIGGGMITGPYFLDKLDLIPVESTATTSYMIIYTALSGVTQFWSTSRLHWISALWAIAIGLIGGLIGQEVVRKALEKFGKQSLIVIFLALLIFSSCIGIVSMGIYEIVQSPSQALMTDKIC